MKTAGLLVASWILHRLRGACRQVRKGRELKPPYLYSDHTLRQEEKSPLLFSPQLKSADQCAGISLSEIICLFLLPLSNGWMLDVA